MPLLLLIAEDVFGQFEESKHKREGKGSKGGQFASMGGGSAFAQKKQKAAALQQQAGLGEKDEDDDEDTEAGGAGEPAGITGHRAHPAIRKLLKANGFKKVLGGKDAIRFRNSTSGLEITVHKDPENLRSKVWSAKHPSGMEVKKGGSIADLKSLVIKGMAAQHAQKKTEEAKQSFEKGKEQPKEEPKKPEPASSQSKIAQATGENAIQSKGYKTVKESPQFSIFKKDNGALIKYEHETNHWVAQTPGHMTKHGYGMNDLQQLLGGAKVGSNTSESIDDPTGQVPMGGAPAESPFEQEQAHHKAQYEQYIKLMEHTPTPSTSEKAALHYYTGSGYGSINENLRMNPDAKPPKSVTELDAFFEKCSLPEDTVVYRKVSNEYAKILKSMVMPGSSFVERGFMSTAGTKSTWHGSLQMVVKLPKGTKAAAIKQYSQHTSENEVLVARNSVLRVIKYTPTEIHVEIDQSHHDKPAKDDALALDPPVSEKQRRAMYAAAAGHSTLGIPKKVGEEFVGKDMSPEDWHKLRSSLLKFLDEEEREPEHAEDAGQFEESKHPRDQGGKFGSGGGGAKGKEDDKKFTSEVSELKNIQVTNPEKKSGGGKVKMREYTPKELDWEYEREYLVYSKPKFPNAFESRSDFQEQYDAAPLRALTDTEFRSLQNSMASAGIGKNEDWVHKTFGHRRDSKRIIKEMKEGETAPPIVLKDGKRLHLMAGQTRLATAAALGMQIESKIIEVNGSKEKKQEPPAHDELDDPPLDVKTPTPEQIAKKHNVSLETVNQALEKGIKVEMEHTTDRSKAREIALDHLNERVDYYTRLAKVEAHDAALALDLQSVRTFSKDGHLHVEATNISKANVCPYYGREIPGADALGLEPDKLYMLYRDPDELAKAAPTFNNLPLLSKHVAISAEDHPPHLVIGSTGTDAMFVLPYLQNSLVVWPQEAIHAIESDQQKELSCAYHYRADMTPGTTSDGVKYDGVMRDIVGNHVALVVEGRAGSDVVVGDSMPTFIPRGVEIMAKQVLSRTAVLVRGAILGCLGPMLAADTKLDVSSLLDGLNAKNLGERKKSIYDGLVTMTKGKLAKDAKIEAPLKLALDAAEKNVDPDAEDEFPPKDKDKDDKEAKDEDPEKKPDMAAKDEDDDDDEDDKKKGKAMDAKLANMVTKDDMAKAIKVATDSANANQRAIREAEKVVRPYVGELAMDASAPEDVYREALKILNVKTDGVHPSALRTILEMQPKPGAKRHHDNIAVDEAAAGSFATMYPDAARLI